MLVVLLFGFDKKKKKRTDQCDSKGGEGCCGGRRVEDFIHVFSLVYTYTASSKAEELPLYLGFQTCHFPITVQRAEPAGRPPF